MKQHRRPLPPSRSDTTVAAAGTGAALLVIYLATLAPGLTLWDAGEFAAAVHVFGIPHPPGTPLYITLARAWSLVLPGTETVVATNALSAVSTAGAMAVLAALFTRAFGRVAVGMAAGVGGGLMATVWLSANETEVYAVSLLLAMLTLMSAERAGRGNGAAVPRFVLLTAYLIALAPAVHLTALIAAPAAIAFVVQRPGGSVRWAPFVLLVGVTLLTWGAGTVRPVGMVAGILLLGAALVIARRPDGADGISTLLVVAIALSALAVMLVRARFDPAVNQGDPSTIGRWLDVIARRQYTIAPLWPRQAPLWLQVGNLFQYADWQVALGVDSAVGASWWRTPFTLAWAALGVTGAMRHRRCDRRAWRAFALLLLTSTLGVVLLLNLKAGPSYGYGILSADAPREARERDYFFAPAFALWGCWAAAGVMTLATRIATRRAAIALAAAVALLPAVLNWRATNRRDEPRASLAAAFARMTLATVPRGTVLFVAGDNDSYPLWHEQIVHQVRGDVSVVTIPLLGAAWYRAELSRRAGLWPDSTGTGWRGPAQALAVIRARAIVRGRPVAAGIGVSIRDRAAIAGEGRSVVDGARESIAERGARPVGGWMYRGLSYLWIDESIAVGTDTMALDSVLAMLATAPAGLADRDAYPEPAGRYLATLLNCPRAVRASRNGAVGRLDSRCNYR